MHRLRWLHVCGWVSISWALTPETQTTTRFWVDKIKVGIIEAQNFILEVKSGSSMVEAHVNFILKNQPIKTLHTVLMAQILRTTCSKDGGEVCRLIKGGGLTLICWLGLRMNLLLLNLLGRLFTLEGIVIFAVCWSCCWPRCCWIISWIRCTPTGSR